MRSALALLAAFTIAACGSQPKMDQDYASRSFEVLTKYEQEARAHVEADQTDYSKLSRKERLEAIANQVSALGEVYGRAEQRIEQLNPPKEYAQLQALHLKLFRDGKDANLKWSQAIRKGDPNAGGMGESATRMDVANLEAVVQEIERLEGPQPKLRAMLESMKKELD